MGHVLFILFTGLSVSYFWKKGKEMNDKIEYLEYKIEKLEQKSRE